MITGQTLPFFVIGILWLASGQSLSNLRSPEEDSPVQNECDEAHDELMCGSNDVTYLNLCEYENALKKNPTIKIVQNGACLCELKEDHEWDPLCATNGQSYANNCDLEKARKIEPSLHIRHLGLCNAMLKRNTITYRELQKVKLWKPFMPKKLFTSLSGRDLADADPGGNNKSPHKLSDEKKESKNVKTAFGTRRPRRVWFY